ncbi:MAG: poly-beta-1,6-N-acetyl-D-glucosamine biosynthesis protein PgaD [Burkholderiales bacterium]|nr:poly-beta-1,6-N-acetyl-D-glucosamine biosynthesis protein PgaD [Burkholderiales bacterium]
MKRPLIIERPDLQAESQRWLYLFLTLAFWLFYLYLWLPLVTLAGWAFGLWRGYDVFFLHEGYRHLITILLWYAAGIGLFSAALIGWAVYNWIRFRGEQRRRHPRPVTLIEQANHYAVQPHALASWRRAKVLVVAHDPLGRITEVTPREPAAATSSALAPGAPPQPGRATAEESGLVVPERPGEPSASGRPTVVPLRRSAREGRRLTARGGDNGEH